MPILELLDVHKSYRSHLSIRKYWILRGLSLSIREGEIFGAIGTNGAGKTTTIKLALGLIFPDAGIVRLFGEDASRVESRRRVGFLPENPYLYDYLTGEEVLDFHARLFGLGAATRRRRGKELLERGGRPNRGARPLWPYSQGVPPPVRRAPPPATTPEYSAADDPR